jgi:hypothetical protein
MAYADMKAVQNIWTVLDDYAIPEPAHEDRLRASGNDLKFKDETVDGWRPRANDD